MVSGEKLHDLLIPNGKAWGEKFFWHSDPYFVFLMFLKTSSMLALYLENKSIERIVSISNDFFETKYDVSTTYWKYFLIHIRKVDLENSDHLPTYLLHSI